MKGRIMAELKDSFMAVSPQYPAKESKCWDLTAAHQVTLWLHHSLEGGKQKTANNNKTKNSQKNPNNKTNSFLHRLQDLSITEQAGRMQILEAVKQLAHYTGTA